MENNHRYRYSNRVSIGFLTIGQSPRTDVMEEIGEALIGAAVVEKGALDGYTPKEIERRFGPKPGETTYVTRLKDGRQVRVAKERITSLLQQKIYELENERVDLIILLCSGEFPTLNSRKPLIHPDRLLKTLASEMIDRNMSLGILVPLQEQEEYARTRWVESTDKLVVAHASPYTDTEEEFMEAAEKLYGSKLVVMDCIGYTYRQKKIIQRGVGAPVLTVRGALHSLITSIIKQT